MKREREGWPAQRSGWVQYRVGWGWGRGGGDGGGWGRGILSAYFTSQWGTCVPFQVDKGAVLAFFSLHPAGVIFNLNIRESSE